MTSRIVAVTAENVKRLRAVRLELRDGMLLIGGRNGQGKSSVLDAIQMALAGKRSIPDRPIRDGAEKAEVIVELDDLVVRRSFTHSGSYLKVESRDGAKFANPQEILDRLCSAVAFDPLDFARSKPGDQVRVLSEVSGLNLSDLDEKRRAAFEERTGVNRDLKAAKAAASEAPRHDGVGAGVQSVSALLQERDRLAEDAAKIDRDLAAARRADLEAERVQDEILALLRRVEELRSSADAAAKKAVEIIRPYGSEMDARQKLDATRDAVARKDGEIREHEALAARAKDNARAAELDARVAELEASAQTLTEKIAAIDAEREARVASAALPVDGLSVSPDGTGVLYRGVPFEQASTAEKIRVSAAVGMALNPKLRLLMVRDGSLLDEESLKWLGEFAEEVGAQVLVERVGSADPMAVIIEDGEVVEDRRG